MCSFFLGGSAEIQPSLEDDEEETGLGFFHKWKLMGKERGINLIFKKNTSLVSKAKQSRIQLPIQKCLELF